jgi:probable F420-dependent oxidoreductase
MKFGVCIPNYGETCSVEGLRTVALEAERMGYDSIWTTDHILMAPESGTPYEKIFESITSLAYLAAITSTVKLGISSLITAMRNPAVVIKQIATIDHFSGGRIILATSAGWNEREFQQLGSTFHDRGRRLDESIKLFSALWNNPSNANFVSRWIPHKFNNQKFEPPPIQSKLTIWVAGNSRAAMKRAATLGDAWHPNVAPLDVFKKLVSEFRSIPEAKGKDICVRIGLNPKATKSEYVSPQGERRVLLSGDMAENRYTVTELEKLGVTHMIVAASPDGNVPIPDQVLNLRALSEAFIRKSSYLG